MFSKVGSTPPSKPPFTRSPFCSRKEKPSTPIASGDLTSDCTMAESFSPKSTHLSSVRTVCERVLKASASLSFRAASSAISSAPSSMPSSTKASRVPEVGGGPRTRIGLAGSDGLTSFHIMYGFGLKPPWPSGISLARARKSSRLVMSKRGPSLAFATTMPS